MIERHLVLFTIFCIGVANTSGGENWGYHSGFHFLSPEHWKELPGTSCGGKRQSPIDIIDRRTVYMKNSPSINISNAQSTAMVTLETSATSLLLSFSDIWTMTFNGEGCFRPLAIHWHWGSSNRHGSEHRLDGRIYVMEGHLVTYNCGLYRNSDEAMKSANGLYVFSMLYQIGDMNSALAKILPHLDVVNNNKQTSIQEIYPTEFLATDLSQYYQYEGSLTTPPCTENVNWTIFREIQTLSIHQISKFRLLRYGPPEVGAMVDNYRPMKLSEHVTRIVYASFKSAEVRHIDWLLCTLVPVIMTLVTR